MYKRHTLLDISPEGRRRMHAEAAAQGFDARLCGMLLLPGEYPPTAGCGPGAGKRPVPGIVRRSGQNRAAGLIPVGFVSWSCGDYGRLRLPAFARPEEVLAAESPYALMEASSSLGSAAFERTPALRALAWLNDTLCAFPSRLGVWGSAALELKTGYYYTHPGSDLDILLEPRGPLDKSGLEAQLALILAAEKEFQLRVDAELSLANGYGVSLKEFMDKGATVLGKGELDARLLYKKEILNNLINVI